MKMAKHLSEAAIGDVTKSKFRIFWQMLIWDMSAWHVDMSILSRGPQLDLIPWHYRQWCSVLDIPFTSSREKHVAFSLSHSYFLTLKAMYVRTRTRREHRFGLEDRSFVASIKDIEAHLNKADVEFGHSCFDYLLSSEGWKRSAVGCSANNWFEVLLYYNFCRLLLSVLTSSTENLGPTIAATAHLFTFFSRIEYSVDRVEDCLINEHELLTLTGSDELQLDDPVLAEGKSHFVTYTDTLFVVHLRLEYLRKGRSKILSVFITFCQVHHDLIRSLLVNVVDHIPTRTRDGRLGWLTEVFMKQSPRTQQVIGSKPLLITGRE